MLRVLNLEAGYGPLRVLKGVSLHVSPGEVVALIGANGAGKTTLLKTVAGILKPGAGSVAFDKQRIDGLAADRIVTRGCALVPEGRHVFPTMTVKENLLLGAYGRRRSDSTRQIAERLDEVYGLFAILKDRRQQLAGTLSGGQQQMLAIGRALMSKPRLLMLDEPSLGVAPLVVQATSTRTIAALKARRPDDPPRGTERARCPRHRRPRRTSSRPARLCWKARSERAVAIIATCNAPTSARSTGRIDE